MNIFKFEFKRLFKGGVIWSIACGAVIVLFMSMFPSMKDMGIQELVGSKMDAMPESLLKAFNINNMVDFSKIGDYSAYVLQYILMAGYIYAIILGASSLSKEETEGTIEFLYSKPVTRSQIVTSKLLSSALIYYMFVMIVGIIFMIMAVIVMPDGVNDMSVLMDLKSLFIGMFFVGYIFMAIGFAISVFIKSSKQYSFIAIAVFLGTYVIGILAKLKDSLKNLIFLSPFDYANPTDVIKSGFEGKYIVAGICIIIVSIICTYVVYNKKDYNI